MEIFRKLGWFFKQEKKSYIIGIILLLFVSVLQLVPPYVIGVVVDLINEEAVTGKALFAWIGLLVIAAILAYVFRYLWRIKIYGSAVKLARQLRSRLYEHFTNMPTSFYQRKRTGDLMAHATNDLSAVQQTAGNGVLTLVDSLSTGGFVIIAMSFIDWRLTLLSLLPMPFIAISTSYYGKLIHVRFKDAQAAFSDLNDKTQESVTGIKVIKTFGQEKEDVESFRASSGDVVNKNIAVARIDALYDPTIGLMAGLSYFLTIAAGAKFVLDGSLTIGQLVAFSTYLGLLIWPMLAFGWLFNIVQRGNASYDRIMALLKEEPEIIDEDHAIKERASGDIEYELISFSYPNEEAPALRDIHMTIHKGETLGIVGRTGSGKTTLLKLLIREFTEMNGDIRIGGHSIGDYALASLREAIGYVPQDHFLFSATVGENIAFATPEASQGDIERAAYLANIHDDILGFTDGYATIVGERGVSLSGGQKQRLSIARALIMDPEILILDDSLSAVDAKTEEIILQNLRTVRAMKTTIITAHRLSAVQHANLIIVMEGGKIIQSGTHEELMKEHGWYRDMYNQQQLEELVEQGGSSK
ncbi:multidrug ABC transporter permease/ATP-binding protein [Pradoshia eiseniae]|uniref:Multidrug ABC transporter permease/ATP-binding protein n=1 Tax=Pradoshia eiseniae TaxID=2064768 RepID=A0A2S7MV82_9BACI|nr:ABC transporter transmembrane domain-containing protein [Pradoshia eiseniae]PQD93711.1 multidrug ABC transporter permease/ATP-binding protein [Pradoshia eiseniae]